MTDTIIKKIQKQTVLKEDEIQDIKNKLLLIQKDGLDFKSLEEVKQLKTDCNEVLKKIKLDKDLYNMLIEPLAKVMESRIDLENLINGTNAYKGNGIKTLIKNNEDKYKEKSEEVIITFTLPNKKNMNLLLDILKDNGALDIKIKE